MPVDDRAPRRRWTSAALWLRDTFVVSSADGIDGTIRRVNRHARPDAIPRRSLRLTDTLEFMQLLWAMVHALERTSKRMSGAVGVTGPQRLVLRVVGLAPQLSAGELASVLHVHPSTLTGVLARLVSQRMLTRIPNPADRRRAILTLTTKGAKINAIQRGTAEAAISTALETISGADRQTAKEVIQRLTEQLEVVASVPTMSASGRRRPGRR
jgi:MarR family transcriptional regulator, organic hydroperoxide resistance regulator